MSQNLNIVLQPILFSFTLIDEKEFPLLIFSLWVLKEIVVSIMTRVNSWKKISVIIVLGSFLINCIPPPLLILVCGFENVINSTKMTTLLKLEENPILFSLCRRLFQLGLAGTLVPDLGNLSHLVIL